MNVSLLRDASQLIFNVLADRLVQLVPSVWFDNLVLCSCVGFFLVTSMGSGFLFSNTFLHHSFQMCHALSVQISQRVSSDLLFGSASFQISRSHAMVVSSIDRSTLTPRVPTIPSLAHSHWNKICYLVSIPPHIGHVGGVLIPR